LFFCMHVRAGKFAASNGTANCAECPVGRFASVAGVMTCQQCSAGRYQDVTGQAACELCNAGESIHHVTPSLPLFAAPLARLDDQVSHRSLLHMAASSPLTDLKARSTRRWGPRRLLPAFPAPRAHIARWEQPLPQCVQRATSSRCSARPASAAASLAPQVRLLATADARLLHRAFQTGHFPSHFCHFVCGVCMVVQANLPAPTGRPAVPSARQADSQAKRALCPAAPAQLACTRESRARRRVRSAMQVRSLVFTAAKSGRAAWIGCPLTLC